jgi:hypothetical protein
VKGKATKEMLEFELFALVDMTPFTSGKKIKI